MDVERPRGIIAYHTAADAAAVERIARPLFGEQGHAIIAHTTDVQFLHLAEFQIATQLPQWDEGRLFGEHLELRWRRLADGQYTLLLLTERQQYVPQDWEWLTESWRPVEHCPKDALRLWGKRQEHMPKWVEVRIPRLLSYPVPDTQPSVRLSWIEYRDEQGTPRLMRLKGVSDADDGS
jgi:hypothetical protein